jgi:hypothetical protein
MVIDLIKFLKYKSFLFFFLDYKEGEGSEGESDEGKEINKKKKELFIIIV